MKKINKCPLCNCEIWLPDELLKAALRSPDIHFFCSYGHKQRFSAATIKTYWESLAPKAQPTIIQSDDSNIIPFKGKGHETQRNS